jgi:hypothetical protein
MAEAFPLFVIASPPSEGVAIHALDCFVAPRQARGLELVETAALLAMAVLFS